jgi:hypothetical protein
MSAKRRIMKGVRRRIPNTEHVEVFEEEIEEGERSAEEEEELPRRRSEQFSFQADADRDRHLVS